MEVRCFDFEDLVQVNAWLEAREVKPMSKQSLPISASFGPPIDGFIVDGIAAGFLYTTNGNFGILEGYAANPSVNSEDRTKALDLITEQLLELAVQHGFLHVIALTQNDAVRERCQRYGFQALGAYGLFSKEF